MKKTKISHLASLFVAAFLLTAANIIIVPDAAFAAPPPCKGQKNKDDPGCDSGSGGGRTFTVVIGNGLAGGSGSNPWLESFGGRNSIGLNDAAPAGFDVGTLTGVGSFTGQPGDCFPSDFVDPHSSAFQLHQAIIKSGKKGRAEASFWFHGATDNGLVRVLYVLKLFGTFASPMDWPSTQVLTMTDWELKVENESKAIKSISCIGELEEEDDPVSVAITVTIIE